MSMALVCVGRLREKPHRLLADEYIRRLTRYGKFEEVEIPFPHIMPPVPSGLKNAISKSKCSEGRRSIIPSVLKWPHTSWT